MRGRLQTTLVAASLALGTLLFAPAARAATTSVFGGTLAAAARPSDMKIAAAAADIPWTDLAYSLMPNGRTLDYVADAP
jgi:hypothetical protein